MKILMIQNNEVKPQVNLLVFLEKFGKVDEINFANLKIENLDEYNSYDLIILSGSGFKELNGNENLYKREIDLIKTISKPIIGICFGFEIIARAFSETLDFQQEKIYELKKVVYLEKEYTVWQNHFWSLKNLNINTKLEVFGTSENGIEIIKVKDKNIYGLQFHPEHKEDKNDGQEIFEQILQTCL